jgi:hypothetical protein
MTDLAAIYVEAPDIPVGMTVAEYRRSRPNPAPWWRRVLGRRS